MFLEKRAKWNSLKTKSREELSCLNETLSVCFALSSTRRPHLRDASLWCSSALEEAMLRPSRFLFFSFFLNSVFSLFFLLLDLFLEACLKELMTPATQTICIRRREGDLWGAGSGEGGGGGVICSQNEICAVWKIKIKKQGQTPTRLTDWRLKVEKRAASCRGLF